MNVHNKLWLQHSASNSPEGRELFNVCCRLGLQEKVRKPTRGNYLLDLLLTDIPAGVSCSVLPRISDHNSVLSKFALRVDQLASKTQRTWLFDKADWHGLLAELDATDWKHFFGNLALELAVEKFTCYVLECTARYIPKVKRPTQQFRHPWLNDDCVDLIRAKNLSEGTSSFPEKNTPGHKVC